MSWRNWGDHPIVVAIGVIAALGGIATLVVTFSPSTTGEQPIQTVNSEGNTQVGGTGNMQISDSTVIFDRKGDIRNFRNFIPETYLNNLPRAKCNAYMEAREFWNTGITSEMLNGNIFLSNELKKILIGIAETAYTREFFEGRTAEEYYDEMINRLMQVSYDAKPSSGTMYHVIASGDEALIIDDLIVQLVKDSIEPSYFLRWKDDWDRAALEEEDCMLNL
ncbi:MAG: hypothetical protein AAFX78_11635 [Cyanobacteria bacterium J06638_20]